MISHSPPPAVPPQLMLQAARDGDDGSKLSTITDTACTPRITGDTAFAISYLQILVPDRVGPLFDVPNHGSSRGFHVHRVSANRWEFVRTDEGDRHRLAELLLSVCLRRGTVRLDVHSSLLTPRWRQPDSNFSSLSGPVPL